MYSVKKSFTLIESLIVVFLIAILVSLGSYYYFHTIRDSLRRVAILTLHQIRGSILRYIEDNHTWPGDNNWNALDISDPNSNPDWQYSFSGSINSFTITATRKRNPYSTMQINMDQDGNIS